MSKKYSTIVRLHKIELYGEPLDRVPHAKTIHRIILAPLLIFKTIRDFAVCGLRQGLRPLTLQAFEKA